MGREEIVVDLCRQLKHLNEKEKEIIYTIAKICGDDPEGYRDYINRLSDALEI